MEVEQKIDLFYFSCKNRNASRNSFQFWHKKRVRFECFEFSEKNSRFEPRENKNGKDCHFRLSKMHLLHQ